MDSITRYDLDYLFIKKTIEINKQELKRLYNIKNGLTINQVDELNIINARIERREKELQKRETELSKFSNIIG